MNNVARGPLKLGRWGEYLFTFTTDHGKEWHHMNALSPDRELPNPESVPLDKRDLDMRRGAGTPVPFPVATLKPVTAVLKRACAALGISIATAVTQAPLVSVPLSCLHATQPTVDPKVVTEFVQHPDAARTRRKHHPDGRQIDIPLVVETDNCFYIYDGHHRCCAAVIRGDREIVVRLLRLGSVQQMSIIHAAGKVWDKHVDNEIDDEANSRAPKYKELSNEALSKSRNAERNPSAKNHQAAADAHREAAKANAGIGAEAHERDANKHKALADDHRRREATKNPAAPKAAPPKYDSHKDKAFQESKKADNKATDARREPTKENHQAAAKAHSDAAKAHRAASTSKGDRNDRVARVHEGEAKHHESAAKSAKSSGSGKSGGSDKGGGSGSGGANQYGPYSQVHDQDVMTKQFIRARVVKLSVLDSDGKPPKEFCIFPFGKFETSKGTFVFDEKAAKSVLGFYKDQGNDLSIDYEHMAVCDPPVIAPAAGHFNLELRKEGLYAVQVRWTPRAAEMLKNKEYKYFSPAFAIDKESHRITKLLNIALTNIPATKNMAPLVAAKQLQSTINLARAGVLPGHASGSILRAARIMRHRLRRVEARMTARRRYTRGVVNGLAKGGFVIQSLVFPKSFWKKESAKKWAKDHDFAPQMDESIKSFRFRQRDPENFESLTTICLAPSGSKAKDQSCKIRAVGGLLKKKNKISTEDVVAEPMRTNQMRKSRIIKAASGGGKATINYDVNYDSQDNEHGTISVKTPDGKIKGEWKTDSDLRITENTTGMDAHSALKVAEKAVNKYQSGEGTSNKDGSFSVNYSDIHHDSSSGGSKGGDSDKGGGGGGHGANQYGEYSQSRSQKVQTRQKENTVMARRSKSNKRVVAASSAKSIEVPAHAPPPTEMYDQSGQRVDVLATDISHKTAKRKNTVKLSEEPVEKKEEEVEVVDSGDSADSEDSTEVEAEAAAEDSGDSADTGDSKEVDSEEMDSASMEAASDSDSDYEDSDEEEDSEEFEAKKADGVAAKKTPSNPDANVAASAKKSKKGTLSTVVANVTGTRKRGEQIGTLVALKAAQDEIKTLSDKIAKGEARDRKNRVRRIVASAINEFRLMPRNREQAIKCGLKYGTQALRSFIKTFSADKAMLKTEKTSAREADTNVKVVSATLTKEDREVIRKLGLDESSFVEARMAQETRKRTGEGRGAH